MVQGGNRGAGRKLSIFHVLTSRMSRVRGQDSDLLNGIRASVEDSYRASFPIF